MTADLLGAYQPGSSVLHRLPAGVKLVALLGAGVALAVIPGWRSAAIGLTLALALAVLGGVRARVLVRRVLGLILVIGVLAGYLTWQHGWERAGAVSGDLLALAVLAAVVTSTTPVDEVLDAITRGLRPLRRVGVNPEQVALAFSLLLRAIPTTLQIALETRSAARARGLQRSPRALLGPMVIRVIAHARGTGEALQARGIGDD